ncbi:hypothetical protein [Pedobacter gandavensis]|uniref:hypothetical protein n=1 Tax=Pedobacter gandavensis TaxID=2679963 RepID=UPI0029318440|nr:hypothetical protein [Pedobacter gandavensis]
MKKPSFKSYIPYLALCLFAFLPQKIMAQTFKYPGIFTFWDSPGTAHTGILKKKGFSEVYGGPKKQGGSLYLYHNKNAQEYLFIHYTDSGNTSSITYYLPTKLKYLNLQVDQKTLNAGESIRPHGRTSYNDGKKYYQISFMRSNH